MKYPVDRVPFGTVSHYIFKVRYTPSVGKQSNFVILSLVLIKDVAAVKCQLHSQLYENNSRKRLKISLSEFIFPKVGFLEENSLFSIFVVASHYDSCCNVAKRYSVQSFYRVLLWQIRVLSWFGTIFPPYHRVTYNILIFHTYQF